MRHLDDRVGLDVPTILKMRTTASGTDAEPGSEVHIDVEPAEIPPVTFSQRALIIPADTCVTLLRADTVCRQTLFVSGTYPGGTEVSLNKSSRLRLVSHAPSIVKVWKGGSLVGVSPGSTRAVIFGDYTIDITVVGRRR
jgi:hypothetical protein